MKFEELLWPNNIRLFVSMHKRYHNGLTPPLGYNVTSIFPYMLEN